MPFLSVFASRSDETAFAKLISEHQGIILKVCRMYQEEPEARKDLFQEIVLQLWRSYPAFRGQSKISTWMYRVALNTAISGFRRAKRRPAPERLDERLLNLPELPEDEAYEEKRRMLYAAIEGLSDVEKAVVLLYLEEKSYDEIAEIAGITRNYVGVLLNRVKSKLRSRLMAQASGNP
jgi:RNA polymerase sigma-70 factor (ECF subfamily)